MCNVTSVIGLSKNAGKTTLLNYLLTAYGNNLQKKICVTSIGVDGETRDVWTGAEKPTVFITEGTLIATTKEGIESGTAKWRLLEKVNIPTPAGDIYLAEAVLEGTIKVLGIPIIDNLLEVIHTFKSYGGNEIFIDGAYDRLSSANPYITNQTYLAIGASLTHQEEKFERLVFEKLSPFFYPVLDKKEIHHFLTEKQNMVFMKKNNGWVTYPPISSLAIDEHLTDNLEWLIIPGVLTEQMLLKMLKYKKAWNIVLKHGLKSFVTSSTAKKWRQRGGEIYVQRKINLKGIAYNPYSPEGYSFDRGQMKAKLENILNSLTEEQIPIFDILRD